MRRLGHEAHLLAGPVPETEGSMEYYADDCGVTVERIPELTRPLSPWKDMVALYRIFRFLRRERPDVVHTHTSKAGTLGRMAALLAGTPVVIHTFHGSVFDGYFSPAKTRLFLSIERVLARWTDRVITVSDALKRQLSDTYRIAPAKKIEVVRLGFDLGAFAEMADKAQRNANRERGESPVVGWVGRFTEIKDPLLFVEVASALKAAGVAAKFLMVGDGPLREESERAIAKAGLSPDFLTTGWQRDMPQVYSKMDVLVATSRNEGTPVTIIEAMATGCPFVAPDVGGLVDLAQGEPRNREGAATYANGILVTRRDAGTFQRAVRQLLNDVQLRTEMGRAGRQFVLDNFGAERLVRETERLYERFVRSKVRVPQQALSRAENRK